MDFFGSVKRMITGQDGVGQKLDTLQWETVNIRRMGKCRWECR